LGPKPSIFPDYQAPVLGSSSGQTGYQHITIVEHTVLYLQLLIDSAKDMVKLINPFAVVTHPKVFKGQANVAKVSTLIPGHGWF